MPNISYCGLDCNDCTYRKDQNCVTCRKGTGTVWYGKCVVAKCVMDKSSIPTRIARSTPVRIFWPHGIIE